MEARLNLLGNPISGKIFKHFIAAGTAVQGSAVPRALQELVSLRVSLVNGCAVCVDIHTKEAAAAGESTVRINLVPVWREATVYTEAERAAFELAEQGTRIADGGGVSDDVWANAAKHYDEDQLVALVAHIALMNAVNRFNVITQQPAGGYEAGQIHKAHELL
jgi:AhpD family alkylhydroperoxidase